MTLRDEYKKETGKEAGLAGDGYNGPSVYAFEYVFWLEEEVKKLRAQLQWRNIEIELPEKQEVFFVKTPYSYPKNSPFQIAEFYDDNYTFYSEASDEPLTDVTHWLPIPELKK